MAQHWRKIRRKNIKLQTDHRLESAKLEIFNVIESKSKELTIGLIGSSLVTFEELKEKKKAFETLKENYSHHEDKERQILYDMLLEINRIESAIYQLDIQIAENHFNDSRQASLLLHDREWLNQKKTELKKDYEAGKNSNYKLQDEYINKTADYLGVKSKISQQNKENPKLDMLYQEISYTEQILEISDKINELDSILASVSGNRQILEINKKIKELKNEQSNLLEKGRYFNIINSILFFFNDIKENKTTLTKVLHKIKEKNYQQTTKILEQIPNFNKFNKEFETEDVSSYIHNVIDLQKTCREQINSDKKELQSQELSDRELLKRLFAMFSQSQKPKTKKEFNDIEEKIKTYIQHKRTMIERKMLFYTANIVSAYGIKMDKGFRNEQDFLLIYAKLAHHSMLNDNIFTTLKTVHSFVQWDKNFSSQEETNSLFEKPLKPSDETLLPLYNILAEDSSINTKSLLEICDKYNVLDIELIIAQQLSRKDLQNQTHFLVKIYKGLSEVWNYLMDQQKIITIKEGLVQINQQLVKVNSIMSMVKQKITKIEDNLNENFIDGILENMMYKNKFISNEEEGAKLKKQIVESMRVDRGAIQKIVSSVDLIYWQFTDLLFKGKNEEAVDQYVIIQEKLLKGNSELSYKDIYKYLTGVDILERDIKVTDIVKKIHLLIQNGIVNNSISARSECLNKEWGHDVSKKLERLYNVFYMCHFLQHNSNSRALYFDSLRDKFNEVWDQLDRNKHRISDVESRVQVELELQYTRRVLDSDFSNVNYQNMFNMISDQDLQFVIQLIIIDLSEEKGQVEIGDVVTKSDRFGIKKNEYLVKVIKEMLQLLDNGKYHNIRGCLPSILQQKTPIEELTLSVNACVSSLSQNNILEKTHLHQTSQNTTLLDGLHDLKELLDNIVKSGKKDETEMNLIYRYLNNVKAPLQELEINIDGEIESLLEVKGCYDSSKKQDISVITNYLSLKYAAKKTIQRLQNNIEDFINLEIYDKIQPVNNFASMSNMDPIPRMRNYYNVIYNSLENVIEMHSKSAVLDRELREFSLLKDIIRELDKQFNMILYDDTKLEAALLQENIQNLELVLKEIDSLDKQLSHQSSFHSLEQKPEGVIKDISSKVLLKNMTIKIRSIKDKIKKIQTNQNVMKESVLYNLLTESIDAINKFEHGVDTKTQESRLETQKQLVLEFNELTGKQEKADDIYNLYALNNNNFRINLQNIYENIEYIPDENIENVIDIRKQIENYNRLFDEKHNLYTVFLTTRNEKIQLEHKIESANKECIAIKEKDDTRTKELQLLEKKITDLNKTLETLQKDKEKIVANLEKILKLHEETKTALQLNSENRLNAEEQKRPIDMTNDLKNQENDILKANKQLGDITTKSNEITEEIEKKQKQLEEVKKNLEELKSNYKNKQTKIDEIKKQLNTKVTEEQNVQQNIDTKQEKILNEIQQTFEKIKNGIEKVEEDTRTAYWKFRGELETLENSTKVFMERPEDLREIIIRTNVTLKSVCTVTKNNVESAINELDKATYGINTILNNSKFTTKNSKFTTEEWRMLDELQQEQIKKTKEDLQKLFERIETWTQKQEIQNERENEEQEYDEEQEQEYDEEVNRE